jgi:hypothetical protein
MTLILELPPEKEAVWKAEAQAHGLTIEQWLEQLAERSGSSSSRQDATAEDATSSAPPCRPLSARIREIWADLPEEARAEYPEGGAHQIDHHVYGLPKR